MNLDKPFNAKEFINTIIESSSLIINDQEDAKIMKYDENTEVYENIKNIVNLADPTEPLKCDNCYFLFTTNLDYALHSAIHNDGRFVCHMCEFRTLVEESLKKHMSRHDHFKCTICGKELFLTRKVAFEHSMGHVHGAELVQCYLCSREIERANLSEHTMTSHQGKPGHWRCDECGKEYVHRMSLRRHYSKHHKECGYVKAEVCDVCGKIFDNLLSLEKHKTMHAGQKPLSCQSCPMKFKNHKDLKVHSRTHKGEMPYQCQQCGKKLKAHSAYVYHLKVHAGEKTYSCPCGEAFVSNSNMRSHLKVCDGVLSLVSNLSDVK